MAKLSGRSAKGVKRAGGTKGSTVDIVYAMLEKKFKNDLATLESYVVNEFKNDIKEDCGGLISSIHTVEIENPNAPWAGGRVLVDVPYAKFVNDGRGEIVPKNAKVLTNKYTTAPFGHSPFTAKYSRPFKGYHSLEKAIVRFKQSV